MRNDSTAVILLLINLSWVSALHHVRTVYLSLYLTYLQHKVHKLQTEKISYSVCCTYGVRNWYWHPWDPACHVPKQCTCLTDLPKSRIVIVKEQLCSYLTPLLLLDGLAGVRKLALELLFPNAGVEGGLLVLMRGPYKRQNNCHHQLKKGSFFLKLTQFLVYKYANKLRVN